MNSELFSSILPSSESASLERNPLISVWGKKNVPPANRLALWGWRRGAGQARTAALVWQPFDGSPVSAPFLLSIPSQLLWFYAANYDFGSPCSCSSTAHSLSGLCIFCSMERWHQIHGVMPTTALLPLHTLACSPLFRPLPNIHLLSVLLVETRPILAVG